MFQKWDSSVQVHIWSPPSCCSPLCSSLSPESLATWPVWSPLSGFLLQPLEKLSSSCTKERASNYNRQSKTASSYWILGKERATYKKSKAAYQSTQPRKRVGTLSKASAGWLLHWPWMLCSNRPLNNTMHGKKVKSHKLMQFACIYFERSSVLKLLKSLALHLSC